MCGECFLISLALSFSFALFCFLSPLQLREEFDRGIDVQLDEEHSIHDVAALLKEFLRDMPDPLLTKELYTAFINTTCKILLACSPLYLPLIFLCVCLLFPFISFCLFHPSTQICNAVLDSDEQHNVTQLLVYLLPACNSDTLHRLLEFLSTVTDHAHDRQDKDGQEVSASFYQQEIWLPKKSPVKPKQIKLKTSGQRSCPKHPTWRCF